MSRNIINQHPIYTWYYSYPEKEKRMLAQGDRIWQNTFGVSLDRIVFRPEEGINTVCPTRWRQYTDCHWDSQLR